MQWWQTLYDIRYTEGWREPEDVTRSQVDFLEAIFDKKRSASIIDIACGYGRHLFELARQGYSDLTGLDYSDLIISDTRNEAEKQNLNISFHQGDMRNFDLDCKFDFILIMDISFGFFSEEENRAVLGQASKHLKAEGHLLLHLFNPYNLSPNIRQRFSPWENGHLLLESIFDPVTGILSFDTTVISQGKESKHPTQKIRVYTLAELIKIAEKIDLKLADVYGNSTENNLENNRFNHKSEEIIPVFKPGGDQIFNL